MKCHRAWTPAVRSHANASETYGSTGWRASDGDAGFRADHFTHDVGEAVDVRVVELLERVPRRRRDVGQADAPHGGLELVEGLLRGEAGHLRAQATLFPRRIDDQETPGLPKR